MREWAWCCAGLIPFNLSLILLLLCHLIYSFKEICTDRVKAINIDSSAKDFVKLNNDNAGNALRYFIMLLKNHSKETINSIQQKIANKGNELLFYCYSLEGDRGKGIDLTNQF